MDGGLTISTPFAELAHLVLDLESTSRKKEKTLLISDFLRNLEENEISPTVLLVTGKVFPEFDPRSLDVGWVTLRKVIEEGGGQTTLLKGPLTIVKVHETLLAIASAQGPGSRNLKERLLEGIYSDACREEVEVLNRIIFGEMRIGVSEGVMIEAIAETVKVPLTLVRRALMFTGDMGLVAETAIILGQKGLKKIKPSLFTPLKPMLATMASDINEAIDMHGGNTAFEYKFDGARIQIHRKEDDIKIFTRNLSDITESLPDIVHTIYNSFARGEYIMEGEVTAVGPNDRPLPFQDLMRRFTRVKNVKEMTEKIPLHLHIFDILYFKDRLLIDTDNRSRRKLLEDLLPRKYLVKRLVTSNHLEAELMLEEAIKAGHEGLMAKKLGSHYAPGARGKLWLKIKPVENLDVVIRAADWGSGRRKGWLSNYHLSVKADEEYLVIGKTFKGLTDEQFKWMTKELQKQVTSENSYTVNVSPGIVVEVSFNEIQKSPNYKSGYALRFARVKRIREDKPVEDVDTLERVIELYEKQFKHKDKFQ